MCMKAKECVSENSNKTHTTGRCIVCEKLCLCARPCLSLHCTFIFYNVHKDCIVCSSIWKVYQNANGGSFILYYSSALCTSAKIIFNFLQFNISTFILLIPLIYTVYMCTCIYKSNPNRSVDRYHCSCIFLSNCLTPYP